jgi:hypothetical protein
LNACLRVSCGCRVVALGGGMRCERVAAGCGQRRGQQQPQAGGWRSEEVTSQLFGTCLRSSVAFSASSARACGSICLQHLLREIDAWFGLFLREIQSFITTGASRRVGRSGRRGMVGAAVERVERGAGRSYMYRYRYSVGKAPTPQGGGMILRTAPLPQS